MVAIGNFLYRYRNFLFILLYLLLFIPSPKIFNEENFGPKYYYWPITIGLVITILGQLIRGLTIGLAYIIRGGKDKKVYADTLVTTGIFNHCRNPLYVGNILMLLGAGILANSLIYLTLVIPFFLFTYDAIVLAEEHFLRTKFGNEFNQYCKRVNRWVPSLKGLTATFRSMRFRWKRWLIKEYNTQYVWMTGISLIILFGYPELTNNDASIRNLWIAILLTVILIYYLFVRFMKKTGKWTSE